MSVKYQKPVIIPFNSADGDAEFGAILCSPTGLGFSASDCKPTGTRAVGRCQSGTTAGGGVCAPTGGSPNATS